MKNILLILTISFVISCSESSDSRFDSGYSDGYASGYNTTCKIRATMIEGDWNDKDYSAGYDAGYFDGSTDCKKSADYR